MAGQGSFESLLSLKAAIFWNLPALAVQSSQFDKYSVAVGQTNYNSYQELQSRLSEFKKAMEDYENDKNFDLLIMMFTDVKAQGSHFLYYGSRCGVMDEIIENCFDEHSGFDSRIMSRKQQLIPLLNEILTR